ncbi:hypothetical protein AAGU66_01565 [Edwardsiella ictaluri]|uniref:Uncharacterized protein n=1 Tax=Edwardsiella ictaluri TaxID=67780 RepID=A0ABY8GKW4_EDWIC|nr:hypothetical protein [Edwardsiella ictaluri]UYB62059.1 hypothetical protein N8I66_01945 [Edwardsiella ictaluri]UYB65285.1 hypothetical protein N8I67_01945 [Edwardsiella ictaluri]WFN97972.1 hypothetical protein MAY91_08725 [Edwardsiella ictaluri]WFO10881.1 hypothetical protein MAY76_06155 [Edwardsiella ictaluri]WFO13779.1 hypothetical protein MAY82_06170 [Edwardsiella ictaluri]
MQSTPGWIEEANTSAQRTQQYRKTISDFPRLIHELRQQLTVAPTAPSGRNLNSLLYGCDSPILELAKLKGAIETLTEAREAIHRYLFWAADIDPVGLRLPADHPAGAGAPAVAGYPAPAQPGCHNDADLSHHPASSHAATTARFWYALTRSTKITSR